MLEVLLLPSGFISERCTKSTVFCGSYRCARRVNYSRARGAAQCRLLPAEHLDDLPAGIGEDCPLVVVGLGRIETPRLSAAWVVAGFIVRGAVLDLAIQDARRNNGGANARRGVSPVCGGCVRPRCGDFLEREWVAGAILRQRCCGSRRAVWAPLAQRAPATASTRPRVQPTQRNDRNFARTGRLPRERATRTLLIRSTASWTPA